MARDTRTNAKECHDRNKYYKRFEGTQEYNVKPSGVFYSMDRVPLAITPVIINGKVKGSRREVTIVTYDTVSDLTVDDIVEYGGERFRVDKIVPNDVNDNKQFSRRPRFETEITLVK